ncbi:c-type cytochrome biogenesis protein CcmI [Litoribacillus peritrichatus]|uniref:C-type cytochrome biogenesis protein CcmI n=1 Tax=Litoribacillus peritrichatus TaxID=718191 RepID=A0ABP7M7T2_9GAMM
MTLLWLVIALMTAVMLLLFLMPLRMAKSFEVEPHVKDQSVLNTQVFKEHVNQLEQDLAEGLFDQASFDEQKRELEDRYLLDMQSVGSESAASANHSVSSKSFVVLAAIGLICSVGALATYNKMGVSPDSLEMAESLKQVSDLSEEELLVRLEQQLEENPDRLDGQLLLARTYLTLGRTADAIKPLRVAVELSKGKPGEAMVLANLAQAVYFSDPSTITQEAEDLIAQALTLDPQEPTALGLAGIFAFEKEDYQTAIDQWQKILGMVEDGPNAESLRQGIANARKRLEEKTGVSSAPAEAQVSDAVAAEVSDFSGLTVAVGVTDDVRSQFAEQTKVFVYARHVNGPRMPLSIQTTSLSELPLQLTLDDSTSMAGMAKLSDAEQVEVVARISITGTAMPSEGDVEVVSKPVVVAESAKPIVLELTQ